MQRAAVACSGGAGERGSVQVMDMNLNGLHSMYLMMGGRCG